MAISIAEWVHRWVSRCELRMLFVKLREVSGVAVLLAK
jgi:hypothetical protein